jgi:hypothetical protein
MKHNAHPFEHTGLCHVCGKPTRPHVHVECGRARDAAKQAIVPGIVPVTAAQREKTTKRRAQRSYSLGKIPPFCKL